LASLKWGTDYLMACRPSSTEFVGQVSCRLTFLHVSAAPQMQC